MVVRNRWGIATGDMLLGSEKKNDCPRSFVVHSFIAHFAFIPRDLHSSNFSSHLTFTSLFSLPAYQAIPPQTPTPICCCSPLVCMRCHSNTCTLPSLSLPFLLSLTFKCLSHSKRSTFIALTHVHPCSIFRSSLRAPLCSLA